PPPPPRPPRPWSGRRPAIRHPEARPRRPGSRPGRAAWRRTHYCVDPPGASSCWTSDIRKICEVPGPFWPPTSPLGVGPTTLHDEEPLKEPEVYERWDRLRAEAEFRISV